MIVADNPHFRLGFGRSSFVGLSRRYVNGNPARCQTAPRMVQCPNLKVILCGPLRISALTRALARGGTDCKESKP